MSSNSPDSDTPTRLPDPEPAFEPAVAADPNPPRMSDPKETDVQPQEAENSGEQQSLVEESVNSVQVGKMSDDVRGMDSEAVPSKADEKQEEEGNRAAFDTRETLTELDEKREEEGNRAAFDTRETLTELIDGDADGDGEDGGETDTPHRESNSEPQIEKTDPAMELINSVIGLDEESRSRQRILTFAAKRYAAALEKNPEDYDALYNWALVLQESADNVSSESTSPSKDALLKEACRKYEEATRLCPTLNDAFYNWAIAISDRAKLRGRTEEAEELWKQATKNYERAVHLNWNSPQALNNWGLALQELSSIVPTREKQTIVRTAISKFRAAIRLQYDFHRAIYNLGTVLYGLAEDISRTGGHVNSKDMSSDVLYSQSAIYIAAAHALKPNYPVYTSALKLVRSMLPLPYLKAGYLAAAPVGNPIAPHNKWQRTQFVLNHEGLQESNKQEHRQYTQNLPSISSGSRDEISEPSMIRVEIQDIVSVSACADLTLPRGAGLCIDTIRGPVFLVAESWESLDGWLDAIRLVYTIFARGRRNVLASIITA